MILPTSAAPASPELIWTTSSWVRAILKDAPDATRTGATRDIRKATSTAAAEMWIFQPCCGRGSSPRRNSRHATESVDQSVICQGGLRDWEKCSSAAE